MASIHRGADIKYKIKVFSAAPINNGEGRIRAGSSRGDGMRTPVVASDCSALPELVKYAQGGFLCKPGDVNAFVIAIMQMIESENMRHEMGAFNRQLIEQHFTLASMAQVYQRLFQEVMDNPG